MAQTGAAAAWRGGVLMGEVLFQSVITTNFVNLFTFHQITHLYFT